MGEFNKGDASLSTKAFEQIIIPTMPEEKFTNTEGTQMDMEELTDWITESGLRFEHKHNEGSLKGYFVMRALRHNNRATDLQKFAGLILGNKKEILSSLVFTRTFGNLSGLKPGDFDLVEADLLVEYLATAAEQVFGYEGALKDLSTIQGVKTFLQSGIVGVYSKDNAEFLKIPLSDLT